MFSESESTFTYKMKNVKLSSVPVTVCAGNPPPPISKKHHNFWKGLDTSLSQDIAQHPDLRFWLVVFFK